MRKLFALLCFITLSGMLLAQLPQGKLYVRTSNNPFASFGQLGYVSYPDKQFHFIDSSNATDLNLYGDKLYASTPTGLKIYDTTNFAAQGSVNGIGAILSKGWSNFILVATSQPPYLRSYDINSGFFPSFVIDTPLISDFILDLCIDGNTAYIVTYARTIAYDLVTKDTIATLPEPGVLNQVYIKCKKYQDHIYLVGDAPTGAPHQGLFRVHESTFALDTLVPDALAPAFTNGIVIAYDKVFAWNYQSYYSFVTDTQSINYIYQDRPIVHDQLSDLVFTHKFAFGGTNTLINLYNDTVFVDSTTIANSLNAVEWAPWDISSSLPGELPLEAQIKLYPNPNSGLLRISGIESLIIDQLRITDINGKTVKEIENDQNNITQGIDINNLPAGNYFLQITTGEATINKQFIKH